jgi:carbamoyl-phosphate synthase large subunit
MCDLATKTSLGYTLKELGYQSGIYPAAPYIAVKVPVFSFEKLTDVDTQLGPEMKSTGEVLGIGKNLKEALYKGLIGAGYHMNRENGGVFITVRKNDQPEIFGVAKKFADLGFTLYATQGTSEVLKNGGLSVVVVNKIHENHENNTMTLLSSGKIDYVISTSAKGRDPHRDSVKIRRKASLLHIPCLTSIDTANALADSLLSRYSETNTELVDINRMNTETREISFVKMQGCGNDYIYIDCMEQEIDSPESLTILLSDRHYGIGGDGIVLIGRSEVADAKMRMFNYDGSEGLMCGNAVRCIAKYLYDNKIAQKEKITIETRSGIKTVYPITQHGRVKYAIVDMGKAELAPEQIPVELTGDRVVAREVTIGGDQQKITCVSMGNPHCVILCEDLDHLNLQEIGPKYENDPLFPQRANIEFVKVENQNTIKMRVWERGTGETMACGTGACAAAVACVLQGYCEKGKDITVKLLGGDLIINYTDERVMMKGDAQKVFSGTVEI